MALVPEYKKMIRVLKVATRPKKKEFNKMAKVTIIGVVIMGIFGIIIATIFSTFDKL